MSNNIKSNEHLIIVFARQPIARQVKTRLIPSLGSQGACDLYLKMLWHTIETIINMDQFNINLCITPESNREYFEQHEFAEHFEISIQQGDDLGQRMYNALGTGLNHYQKVILVGTDCPSLSAQVYQQTIECLDDYDIVFNPAYDGGYVLIAATKIKSDIFTGIHWGSDQVMMQTRQQLQKSLIKWTELKPLHDIDEADDLQYLYTITI